MKFKKLFPLITAKNIEVYSRNGDVLIFGRTEEIPWDKVDKIKNRQVVLIYSYGKKDYLPEEDGDTIVVTVEDELKLKGVKNGNC